MNTLSTVSLNKTQQNYGNGISHKQNDLSKQLLPYTRSKLFQKVQHMINHSKKSLWPYECGNDLQKRCPQHIVYNQQMFYIYKEEQQSADWQMAYHQLQQRYNFLAISLQSPLEGEAHLRSKIENVRSENQKLKNLKMATKSSQTQQNQPVSFQGHLPESDQQKTTKTLKKRQLRIKKQCSTELDSIGSASIYQCTYHDCQRVYSSPVSLNLHIKTKHNGGTKKQREACAKMIIEAEESGDPPQKIDINFPPNFLKQFKVTYQYMKKYKM